MTYGKVIELFLVNGTADSLITAELSNWNGMAVKIPRVELSSCNNDDITKPGVYFLFCKEDDGSDSVYIGEAENVQERLKQHVRDYQSDKETYYWNTAVIFVGRDLNKAMIRYLENNEKQNIRPLYEHCFDDTKEYTDYYFQNRLPGNHVIVNERDNKIVNCVHLIPKTVILGKLKTNIIYIYGVGTYEEYRKQGIMSETFKYLLKDMFMDMEAFTYLIPSDEEKAKVYSGLGFEYVMDKQNLKPVDQRKKATHSLIYRKAEKSDLIRLAIFAQASMEKNYSVSLAKDSDYFKKINELIKIEGGDIDIYVENKVIVGYRIWIDGEILEEVLDSSIQSLNWLESTGKPYVMARIINIRKTVRLLGFQGEGRKILKITDPVLEENNGCFILTYGHGNVKLDKVKEEQLMEDIEFDLTIGELTAHIFGYKIIEGLPLVCKKGSFFINDYL